MMPRRWYAEDIALAMEMIDAGQELWAVALAYGTSVEVLGHHLSRARRLGLAAFPLRSSVKVRRLLKPPVVAGNDARRFCETLSLRA